MLTELLAWWARHMRDLVPERLRSWDAAGGDAMVLTVQDMAASRPSLLLSHRQRGRDGFLGRFTLDREGTAALARAARARGRDPVILALPASVLLERQIALPLAAERDTARVLQYEIDRLTPFSADEIVWRHTVIQRDRANGRLQVLLSLVPKAPLQPLLDALEAAGLPPTRFEIPRAGGLPCSIDLDRAASRQQIWQRRWLIGAGATCGALALAAIVLPFVLQAIALGDVERRIAALRPDVAQAETLRQRIANGTSGIDVMAAERARIGDPLEVLAAVTNALPDDTYLKSFALRQGHLALNGQSAAAAKLIAALSSDPLIRNASFDAPVTRAEQAKADLFSIRADVAPPGASR